MGENIKPALASSYNNNIWAWVMDYENKKVKDLIEKETAKEMKRS